MSQTCALPGAGLKNQRPIIKLTSSTRGNNVTQLKVQTLDLLQRIHQKASEGKARWQSLCFEKPYLQDVSGENTDHCMQIQMEKNRLVMAWKLG